MIHNTENMHLVGRANLRQTYHDTVFFQVALVVMPLSSTHSLMPHFDFTYLIFLSVCHKSDCSFLSSLFYSVLLYSGN